MLFETVSGVTDADGLNPVNISTQTTTDIFGNVIKTVDANGNETVLEYDLLSRPTKTTYADDSIVSVSYDDVTNITTVTDANGGSFRYSYDPWGKCTEYAYLEYGEYIPIESAIYDYAHRLQSYKKYISDNEYYIAEYDYDLRDRIICETVKDKNQQTVSTAVYTYAVKNDAASRPTYVSTLQLSDTDNTFAKTEITKDYLDRTISKKLIDTDGNERTYSFIYDLLGNMLTSSAPDGTTETYTYDYSGNVLTYTNQLGNTMSYEYDMSGLNISSTDFSGNTTTYTYDKLGRMIKTISPFNDNSTSTSKKYYDANGNVTREAIQKTAASYNITDYTYDNMNRISTVKDYPNSVQTTITQYFYDANGNVICMATGLDSPASTPDDLPETSGHVSYSYDKLNRRISKGGTQDGSMSVYTGYSYDRAGNVIGKHLFTGDITYSHDAFGNVTATSGASSTEESFSYNALGLRTSMTDETGTTTYTYDDFGNLTTETKDDIVKTSTYDVMGNRTGFSVTKNGSVILSNTYTYDDTGKMLSVTSNGQTVNYSYDANGNLISENGNNHSTTYAYNKGSMPVTKINSYNNTIVDRYSSTYDLSGNKTSMTDFEGYLYKSYSYDGAGRLLCESVGHERGMEVEGDTEYQYDNLGNRISSLRISPMNISGIYRQYVYGEYNTLQRIDVTDNSDDTNQITYDYTYDSNGNLTEKTKTDSYSSEILEYDTYTFNNAGRMTQSTKDGVATTYTYNGDGLRMSKTTNGVTTSYILDGADVVAQIKGNEITIFSKGINLISQTKGDTTKTYFSDGHGDVTGLHCANSDAKEALYDGYGIPLFNDSSDNPFGYCGEYYDEETGLIYLRNRYYDPQTGRFISEDPAMDGTNWYVYCDNNPVMFVDPWGLDDYIYYGSDQKGYADKLYESLVEQGRKTHMFYIETPNDFYSNWSKMGVDEQGNIVSIDTVYIHLHGEPYNILSSNGEAIYTENLSHKTINTVIMSCCNTGNLDFKYNFSVKLIMSQNINRLFSPDGLGSLFVNNYVYSMYDPTYSNIDRKGRGYIMYENAYRHIKIIPNISADKAYTSIFKLNDIGDSKLTFRYSGRKLFEDRIYKIPFKDPGV